MESLYYIAPMMERALERVLSRICHICSRVSERCECTRKEKKDYLMGRRVMGSSNVFQCDLKDLLHPIFPCVIETLIFQYVRWHSPPRKTAQEIYTILKKVSEADSRILKFHEDSHPALLVSEVLPVEPHIRNHSAV
jgi:hypothetical protein